MKMINEKKRLLGSMETVYVYFERVFDLFALSILWILFSLPVVTIGASTTALYYTTVKVVQKGNGYLVQEYMRSFKANFLPASILWLVIGGGVFILQLNIGILSSLTQGNMGLFFIVLYVLLIVFLTSTGIYAFASLSRFDMPTGWILKLALYMTVRYIPTTIGLLLILVMAGVMVYAMPLAIMIIPAGAIWGMSSFMERVLLKHTPE